MSGHQQSVRAVQRIDPFTMVSTFARARRPLNAALRTPLIAALCAPRDIDDYLALFDATWSVREVRARVVGVRPETGGATTLLLLPNENWRGFRAGQFVNLTVEIGGVRHMRCFSLSSAPEDGLPLRITIRSLAGGRVARWAAECARPGQSVALSQALGDFVLPQPCPAQLLFVAGGSGITPIASIVRHLLARGHVGELAVLHYAPREPILGAEFTALARRCPQLRFQPVLTGVAPADPSFEGRLSTAHLDRIAPDWADRETFVCGPPPLRDAVSKLFEQRGAIQRLHVERFVGPVRSQAVSSGAPCRITFAKSGGAVQGRASVSLLEQAESAGLRPPHGCRMGICHSCTCKKLSGVVRNELTGALSGEPDEEIQLCISSPRSDVTLDL